MQPPALSSPRSKLGSVPGVERGTPVLSVDAGADKSVPESAQRQIGSVGRAQLI